MTRERPSQPYVLLGVAVLVHVFLFSFFGIRDQFVDSQRYIEMSDYLIANGALEHFYQFFYAIPIVLLAIFRVLFGEGLVAYVLFQSILSIVAAFAVRHSAAIAFRNSDAGFAAALIFLLWLDCIQWNTAVMTESLASSLTCFLIYTIVRFKGRQKDFLLLGLLTTAMLMTRPTGVLVVLGAVVFLLTHYRNALRQHPMMRTLTYLCVTLGFMIGAWFMLNAWDFTDQYVKGNIVTYMDVIKGQPLYDETLTLDTASIVLPNPAEPPFEKMTFFMAQNPFHFAKAAVLKVFYVLTFYRPYFSTPHNVYTVIWLSVVYLLFFVGVRRMESKPLKNFAVAVILANCLLVAISAADWDNRFYMPMQPCIVFIAGGGGGMLWRMMTRK